VSGDVFSQLQAGIRTERLIIRTPREEDAAELWAAIEESRERLAPWMPWTTRYAGVEDAEEFIERAQADFALRHQVFLFMTPVEWPKHVLGGTGFHNIDWSVPSVEIGYWLRSSAEGKGYVTEAVRALCDIAFGQLGAQRVAITCDPANKRSRHVPERLGFALEGRLRNSARGPNGSLRDTLVYAALPGVVVPGT
jgi:RimJ/RimL family protein N-acetyltransferase